MLKSLGLGLVLLINSTAGPVDKPVTSVSRVDLNRYAGRWYEIARYPNGFQKNCAGEVTATYSVLPENQVKVVNACRKANGQMMSAQALAKPANSTFSQLKVRFAPAFLSFIPLVWADYWVIDLAPDYSYAVVGTPDRDYLWILSRSPQMSEKTYSDILERVSAQGFAANRLVRTRQQWTAE